MKPCVGVQVELLQQQQREEAGCTAAEVERLQAANSELYKSCERLHREHTVKAQVGAGLEGGASLGVESTR